MSEKFNSHERFTELADLVMDVQANDIERAEFEVLLEANPEWMDEWLDKHESIEHLIFGEVPSASPTFNQSLQARVRADKIRRSLGYWSPAAIAAVAACVGLLAILQMMSEKPVLPQFQNKAAEASLERHSVISIPDLEEPAQR